MENNAAIGSEAEESNWDVYRRLLAYLPPLKWYFALSILGNAIYAAASAGMAKALDFVIETVENPTDENRILMPLLIILLFSARGLGSFLGGYYIVYVGRNVVKAIRQDVFDRYLRLPSHFFDTSSSGHLISRVTFNVEQVAGAATSAITTVVREGLTVVGLMIVMLYENWKLTLLFLLVGPVIGLIIGQVSKRFRKLSKRIMKTVGHVTHIASEVVTGYRVVRVFGGESYETKRFHKANHDNMVQSLKMEFTKAVSTPVIQSLVAVMVAFLVWLALAPEVRGDMTAGSFVVVIAAAATMAKPIRMLTQVNEKIQRGVVAARDVFEVMDTDPEQDQGTREATQVAGNIQLRDVCFAYKTSDKQILKGIDLDIAPGETVALVGRSGSGKSTLANLVPRFYEPTGGQILLDGVPLQEYTLHSLRNQIALVTQHVTLFNDTVSRNIAYGDLEEKGQDAIYEVAKQANALEFIEDKPDGFETMIGDNGISLSGGQRQRLAIARALLKDSPILILDEATSALDNESERYIQAELDKLMEGRTTIVIAHRLSTIESADKIVVMDEGQIVEQGTHSELLDANGMYAKLYEMQFADEESGRSISQDY